MNELKTSIFFQSPNFDICHCAHYKLILSLSAAQFLFALTNESNEVFLLKVFPNTENNNEAAFLNKIFGAEPLLTQKYKATIFISQAEKWLLIPADFLTLDKEEAYLEKIYGLSSHNYWIGKDYFASNELYNAYAVEKTLYQQITNHYSKCEVLHYITPLLKVHYMLHHRLSVLNSGILHIFEEKFVYTIFRDKKLLFCNVFPICNANDVLYYTLCVNQALGLANDRLSLLITGIADYCKELQQLLYSFFTNILNPSDYFFKQPSFNKANLYHYHFSYLLLN
ncbi:MAG: DUF3822 family protein [Bacteroidia bacterium]|nr:DUF3822 family protein [Bacteroidia bacterium]MDW8159492.1 DUF3822 family protein [Bacteroidia bacterium]